MSWLYAIYALIVAGINIQAGLRLVRQDGWSRTVGWSALLIGAIAVIAGIQAVLGFSVDPLFLLIPLTGAGLIILLDSWRAVRETGSFWAALIAIYNSIAWIINLIQLIYVLQNRRR